GRRTSPPSRHGRSQRPNGRHVACTARAGATSEGPNDERNPSGAAEPLAGVPDRRRVPRSLHALGPLLHGPPPAPPPAASRRRPPSRLRAPVPAALLPGMWRGPALGASVIALVYAPFGKRWGAHSTPAMTFAFFRLGKVAGPDALLYACSQFGGAALGVMLGS